MSANVWALSQRRVELPPSQNILAADETMLMTLDKFQNEDMVEIYYEPNDETDYAVHNPDGSISRVCESPQINGVMYLLVPGKQKVPRSVYDFLLQRDADAEDKRIRPGSVNLGKLFREEL